jgi:hypothetical protein
VDLDRGVLAKLRRVMKHVTVAYVARGRSGLFEKPDEHYGEVSYTLGGKTAVSRSSTQEIVLETIYELAGRLPPPPIEEAPYRGYPLRAEASSAPWVFFVAWPLVVIAAWWSVNRPTISRLRSFGESI